MLYSVLQIYGIIENRSPEKSWHRLIHMPGKKYSRLWYLQHGFISRH